MLCSRVSSPMPWLTFPSDPDRALDVLLAPRTSHYCGRRSRWRSRGVGRRLQPPPRGTGPPPHRGVTPAARRLRRHARLAPHTSGPARVVRAISRHSCEVTASSLQPSVSIHLLTRLIPTPFSQPRSRPGQRTRAAPSQTCRPMSAHDCKSWNRRHGARHPNRAQPPGMQRLRPDRRPAPDPNQ